MRYVKVIPTTSRRPHHGYRLPITVLIFFIVSFSQTASDFLCFLAGAGLVAVSETFVLNNKPLKLAAIYQYNSCTVVPVRCSFAAAATVVA